MTRSPGPDGSCPAGRPSTLSLTARTSVKALSVLTMVTALIVFTSPDASAAEPPKGQAASPSTSPATSPGANAPGAAAPVMIEREKTVYVPYEKLEAIFEKEGRGIFLPYEEFLALWKAAGERKPEPPPDLPPADAVLRGGVYVGTVAGDVVRFQVTFDVEALKKGWSELVLPLRGVALETVELSRPDAQFAPRGDGYVLIVPGAGAYQAKISFSVRVRQEPGKRAIAFGVPPAAVSRIDLTIPEEDVRVDVQPVLAVTRTTTEEKATRVLAFLGNSADVSISWLPPAGKLVEDGAILVAEQSVRAHLGERILKISTDATFRVVRGEADALQVRVPENTRLLSVRGDNIREWAVEGEILTVKLHAALRDSAGAGVGAAGGSGLSGAGAGAVGAAGGGGVSYLLALTFERILTETPTAVSIPFPRVEGVIRESGIVVFGHDAGLNVRVRSTTGLSQLDRDEVPEPLRGDLGIAFRYLAQPLALDLEVEKITPVIRSHATTVVSLGQEEDVWVGWIDYVVEKAGVFRFEIRVPTRWNVASVGDEATVEDFQTSDGGDDQRTIAVNLKSKALGAFRMPFRLTAGGSASEPEATHSPPVVVGSRQDRGLFGVSAPKAFDLTTVSREKMNSADVDELFRSGIMNQLGAEAGMPLTYSYREPGSSVKVKLEPKKTEIDVLAQHLVEVSDGGIKYTHILDHEIRYAAVDRIEFTAPTALDNLLKFEAKERKEVRKVGTEGDRTVWEMTLQAPALGALSVVVLHERSIQGLKAGEPMQEAVRLVRPKGAREENGFIAVRKEGELEITPQPTGLEPIDAGNLPDKLRRGQIYSAFRYFAAEPALTLTLTRYEYEQLATTVVNLLHIKAILSEERQLKTEATFFVQNVKAQHLKVLLSPEARIYTITVSGKPEAPKQQRADAPGTWLIQIPTSAGPGGVFPIDLVYEEPLAAGSPMGALGSVRLKTPEVLDDVPVTKVELELYLAPEYAYLAWGGSLNPQFSSKAGLWERFKAVLNRAVGAENVETPLSRQAPGGPPAAAGAAGTPQITFDVRDRVRHDFETLAPVGSLSFVYVGRTLFRLADFAAFLLALGGGWLLLRKARWSVARTAILVIFVPLACVWFTQGAVVEIFTSLLAGGVLLFVGLTAVAAAAKVKECRAARLAIAPDPFLEEAHPRPQAPPAPLATEEPSETPRPGKEDPPAGEGSGGATPEGGAPAGGRK